MPPRLVAQTDWVAHTQWLCHRLSVIDGRLRVPKPNEVLRLGQDLASLNATDRKGMSGALPLKMKGVGHVMARLGIKRARWQREPHHKALPMVGLHPQHGLGLISEAPTGAEPWVIETPKGRKKWSGGDANWTFCSIALGWREQLAMGGLGLAKRVLMRHRGPFLWLLLLSLSFNAAIGVIAWWLTTELHQPMKGIDLNALSLLTSGGVICFALVAMLDLLRRSINSRVAEDLDVDLAREIFQRLLKVRAEVHAPHAESSVAQIQLFESIRSFAHAALTLVLLDIPFAIFFWCWIVSLTSPALGGLALVYVVLKTAQAAALCCQTRPSLVSNVATSQGPANLMMMKAMRYAETLKSLDLQSVFLQRWGEATREQIKQNRSLHHLMEIALHEKNRLRQLLFVVWLLISLHLIEQGSGLRLGAWVGATLLLPRVLHPASSLPALCLQWAQARLALRGIEQLFKLQIDDEERSDGQRPQLQHGQITFQEVTYAHPHHINDFRIGHWLVKAGERVAVVGDLGGGKSTLLKLIAGLYPAQQGQVRIDQIDVQGVPRDLLSKRVAYLPQNVQIFTGTLRDNLLAGLTGVSDAQLLHVCQRVGLMAFVNAHPQGLGMPLQDGFHGLSVGQRQLIGLSRLLLRDPLIWLLDDPLANLDRGLQQRVLRVLHDSIQPKHTLIVVSEQPELLALVQRVVVLRVGRLVMDGPREVVMTQWRSRPL